MAHQPHRPQSLPLSWSGLEIRVRSVAGLYQGGSLDGLQILCPGGTFVALDSHLISPRPIFPGVNKNNSTCLIKFGSNSGKVWEKVSECALWGRGARNWAINGMTRRSLCLDIIWTLLYKPCSCDVFWSFGSDSVGACGWFQHGSHLPSVLRVLWCWSSLSEPHGVFPVQRCSGCCRLPWRQGHQGPGEPLAC